MGKQQARGKEEDAERGKTESTEAKGEGEAMEVDGEREVKAGTDGEAAGEDAGVFEAPRAGCGEPAAGVHRRT